MNERVSMREKLCYAMGDVGDNFVWSTISSFLVLYYTDVAGIAAAAIGTLMLVSRLLDGGTDLVMGVIIDKTHTKWGKARPWVLWSSIPLGISLILLFNVPGGMSASGKQAYVFLTYVFMAAICYTASNIAYNAMLSLVAVDQQDRVVMNTIRFICVIVLALLLNNFTLRIVNAFGGGQHGWTMLSIIYGTLSVIFLLIAFAGTRERYKPVEDKDHKVKKIPVKQSISVLAGNKYFWLVTLLFVVTYINNGTAGVGVYFARDILGDANLFGILSIVVMLPMIIGMPFAPMIVKKMGKRNAMMYGFIISILGCLIIMVNPRSVAIVMAGSLVKAIGNVPSLACLFALIGDVVDYGDWKTNVRIEGLTYSSTSFGMKVGTGLGSAILGWVLAFGKYNGQASVQLPSAILAEKALYIYIPLVLTIASVVIMYFLNIDKIYPQIKKDLDDRRAAAEGEIAG